MHCTYLGSRDHIADLVTALEPREVTVVVDAATINREGIEEGLGGWGDDVERAVLLRPAAPIGPVDSGRIRTGPTDREAVDYLSWLDEVEQRVAVSLPTTVIELPRSTRDWETDIRQAIDCGVLCLIEPGGGMSLVSRPEQDMRVAEAVEADTTTSAGRSQARAVAVTDVVEALTVAGGDAVSSEVLTADDMRAVLTDAGISPQVAQRIIGAQRLAVTVEPTRGTDGDAALEDLERMVRTLADEAGKEL